MINVWITCIYHAHFERHNMPCRIPLDNGVKRLELHTLAVVLHCQGLVLQTLEDTLGEAAKKGAALAPVLRQHQRRGVVVRIEAAQNGGVPCHYHRQRLKAQAGAMQLHDTILVMPLQFVFAPFVIGH